MNKHGGRISLAGVCDTAENRLEEFRASGIPCFGDLRRALLANQYDLVIVCTNEKEHFSFFQTIKEMGRFDVPVICEKPLTRALSEAEQVVRWFGNGRVYVNFVERFSPICSSVKTWLTDNQLVVRRANFFWGKYRIHDVRPTIGVLSEISHPLDLICWFADVPVDAELDVVSSQLTDSNFSPYAQDLPDSAFVTLSFGHRFTISGQSSFVWAERDRRVQLFAGPEDGDISHMVIMDFDKPSWDLDEFVIYDVTSKGGAPVELLKSRITQDDIDPEIFSLNKILGFVDRVVAFIRSGSVDDDLPDLHQSLRVQRILESIHQRTAVTPHPVPKFMAKPHITRQAHASENQMLMHYMRGQRPQDEAWDM